MILTCSIKRDYLGIPYLVVWGPNSLNKNIVLVNSSVLGASPDFCYAFCLRKILKQNFIMQNTEFHEVESIFQQRVEQALDQLSPGLRSSFSNLSLFSAPSENLFLLAEFLKKLLPTSDEMNALLAPQGEFVGWCEWINQCFRPINLKAENAGDYAFYGTLVPNQFLSKVVHLISRQTNDDIESVFETLLHGANSTNHGVRMSSPIARELINSLKTVDEEFADSFKRVAFYLRSLGSIVFPLDEVDWFEGFKASEVLPVDPECGAEVVLASAARVSISGEGVTHYSDDVVSFALSASPDILVAVNGKQVVFDKNLISVSGHVVWGANWSVFGPLNCSTEGSLEGSFWFDGNEQDHLLKGQTGFDLTNQTWVANSE